MNDPRIVNNIKYIRRPKHIAPVMELLRSLAKQYADQLDFGDLDELAFSSRTTVMLKPDADPNWIKTFVDEANRLADGAFILGTWRTRIEDLDDEPEEEE